ncbi:hypothetical protein ACF0H5_016452 [Mactra antiquata]
MKETKKNLWTVLLASFLYILSNNACQCDVSFQDQDDDIATTDLVNDDNNIGDNSLNKRGWNKNFAVWGKRNMDNYPSWEDAEDEIHSGLQIAQIPAEKRKWAKFTSWGKRDIGLNENYGWNEDIDSEKRRTEMLGEPLVVDQILPSIGVLNGDIQDAADVDKRKWSNLAVWGKRSSDNYLDGLVKKWAKFTSWGKRADDQDPNSVDKRKWAQFASWGKRDVDDEITNDVNKRKWSTLAAWGKRAYDANMSMDKRKWSQFASWGKRFRRPQAWYALNNGGKRRWAGLTTWGKR